MSSRPHAESERPLHGPLQRFDLEAEVSRLREEGAWQAGQRNAITLRKGEGMNVVLMVMRSGDRLERGPCSASGRLDGRPVCPGGAILRGVARACGVAPDQRTHRAGRGLCPRLWVASVPARRAKPSLNQPRNGPWVG